MSVKKEIPYYEGIYFITITCVKWISLIEKTKGYDLIYKWFDYLKSKGHFILGYVIMPNHFHVLVAFTNTQQTSINRIIGNGKRFIAYEIVKRLERQNDNDLLKTLTYFVNPSEKKRGKIHEVFERSFDWKECYSANFIEQKLDYIHENPLNEKYGLADSVDEFMHSSAKYYSTGEQGIYSVTNYMEMEDVDLTEVARKNIQS